MNLRKNRPFYHSARVATVQKLVTFLAGPDKGTSASCAILSKKVVITWASDKKEDGMKRERALQAVLVLVGLFYSFWGYLRLC